MALVSVAGPCSRSGKTALAVSLLRAAPPGAAAVKFTTTDEVFERCPRGTPCVVCDIAVPFRVLRDAPTLEQVFERMAAGVGWWFAPEALALD